jgi:hypothetical protein
MEEKILGITYPIVSTMTSRCPPEPCKYKVYKEVEGKTKERYINIISPKWPIGPNKKNTSSMSKKELEL